MAPRQAKVVELRYFGGLTEEEIVAALKISPRTVRRDWDLAKAWLLRELSHRTEQPDSSMTPERFQQIEELYHAARDGNCRRARGTVGPDRSRIAPRSRVASRTAQPAANSWIGLPSRTPRNCWRMRLVTVLAVGASLGPYRIESKLGEGGMGEVFRAVDTRLGRAVAIKITREQFSARFEREARAISSLNHPNICTLHDVGPNYLVMELVEGETIAARLKSGPLPVKTALLYASQIVAALAEAHGKGIVHRDLKPANIMIAKSGIKVLDFGLAQLTKVEVSAEITTPGTALGTPGYMSPEQVECKETDARTDIFSFGAVLYEMLTGRRAFAGRSVGSVFSAILRDEPKPVAEIAHGVPRELDRIVTRCVRKDPDRRYQHAGDLKIDLLQLKEDLAGDGSGVREEKPARPNVGRQARHRAWWWLAATALCVAIAIAAGRLHAPKAPLAAWTVTGLTADAGLSGFPALSRDGKLVAYASDRSQAGQLDLYIKRVAGGQPIRLTTDGAGNTAPDFSPDGSKLVFRSNRDGGGIFEIPAFGGDARLLARGGGNPKYSPDGSPVAYWTGAEARGVSPLVPGSGTVWVVSVSGGQPRQMGANFTAARDPIWSPDGQHLLFIGYTSTKAYVESSSLDWWLVSIDGGEAVKTGAYDALVQAGLRGQSSSQHQAYPLISEAPSPKCWSASDNTVIFSILSGDMRQHLENRHLAQER